MVLLRRPRRDHRFSLNFVSSHSGLRAVRGTVKERDYDDDDERERERERERARDSERKDFGMQKGN